MQDLRTEQQQKQQQRLTPQQVMFGRLLEMTGPQIDDEVRRALDENPALEVRQPEVETNEGFDETAEQLQRADYASDDDIPSYRLDPGNRHPDDWYEPVAADESHTLVDELMQQLPDLDLDEADRRIAQYIIGNIDDNGYLTRDLPAIADDIAIATGMSMPLERVKRVAAEVRRLDPAGVCAVDLRDCLLLQLDRRRKANPDDADLARAREIVADWFDLFSKKHFGRIASQMGITDREMHRALDIIQHLNPKPGSLVERDTAAHRMSYITPDFSVDVDPDGKATVSLLSTTPDLAIEESFDIDAIEAHESTAPQGSARRREALAFIRRRHDEAASLIRLLDMRAATLLAVMKAIVTVQHEFFTTYNVADIRPMILRDIATITGLDLSVISRATAGKYVLTPQGVYPLKMFFNERPNADNDTSSHEITEVIRQLIEAEDKKHPLSDDAITGMLTARGYEIARRTVAKYRERIGLPVARLRKQF